MACRNKPKYLDRGASENSVGSNQTLQNAESDQGPHCLQLIQQIFTALKGNIMDLLKF